MSDVTQAQCHRWHIKDEKLTKERYLAQIAPNKARMYQVDAGEESKFMDVAFFF